MSLAAHGKLAQELDDVLDALHDLEGFVKSRPLLLRNPDNVDNEIQMHKVCFRSTIFSRVPYMSFLLLKINIL